MEDESRSIFLSNVIYKIHCLHWNFSSQYPNKYIVLFCDFSNITFVFSWKMIIKLISFQSSFTFITKTTKDKMAASSTRPKVLSLYKQLLKEGKRVSDYNFRYACDVKNGI